MALELASYKHFGFKRWMPFASMYQGGEHSGFCGEPSAAGESGERAPLGAAAALR
jgi:hypothetical protein